MKSQLTALFFLATTALSSPILIPRQQLIPTLPDLGIVELRDELQSRITQLFGAPSNSREAFYGDTVNKYIPFGDTVQAVVGADNVNAIDILADRLCIAGAGQGSLCNEVLAYAHAMYVAQQNGWTYGFVARSLGSNNVQQIEDALATLCFQPADDQTAQDQGLCQKIGYDLDQNANALIKENTDQEDIGNTSSLNYFGLSSILPPPQPFGI